MTRAGLFALVLLAAAVTSCAAVDPEGPDAPDAGFVRGTRHVAAEDYAEALRRWRSAADVNTWIGARFEYDRARAMRLSETRRQRGERVPIHEPAAFFADPRGVCVDLARFGVETLRALEPASKPAFLMIEFEPVAIGGNTLRLHWLASFRRPEGIYFFADSKRPGHLAGPYPSVAAFMAAYEAYRGRTVVAFQELDSHERKERARAPRQERAPGP